MMSALPESNPESLILGDGRQLTLLGAELDEAGLPDVVYAASDAAGRFTGERIFLKNPQIYRAIASLLGRSMPYREIADVCSVSINTVCGVAFRERVPIETIRERIGRIGLDVAQLTLEAIRDVMADPVARAKVSAKDLAIIFGIATTNAQLLLGGATSRIESGDISVPAHDEYLAFLRTVTPLPTGSLGGNPSAKEASARSAAGVVLELPDSAPASPEPSDN